MVAGLSCAIDGNRSSTDCSDGEGPISAENTTQVEQQKDDAGAGDADRRDAVDGMALPVKSPGCRNSDEEPAKN